MARPTSCGLVTWETTILQNIQLKLNCCIEYYNYDPILERASQTVMYASSLLVYNTLSMTEKQNLLPSMMTAMP
jgi:hypothetical protein